MTIYFSSFNVSSHVFHRTTQSYALVNLKPLVPGHVLICPRRVVARVGDLSGTEISDLFQTVQAVSRMIQRVFDARAVNIAVQDGVEAGQTIPHVHAHIIPRHAADFGGRSDAVYDLLEADQNHLGHALLSRHHHHQTQAMLEQQRQQQQRGPPRSTSTEGEQRGFPVVDDEHRIARSDDEMCREAEWLTQEMLKS